MTEIITGVLPYILVYGVIGGFATATIFNLLARGINSVLSIFRI